MHSAVHTWPIEDQVAAIENGTTSAAELARAVRDDIDRAEPALAAWVQLATDHLAEARLRDDSGQKPPLRGISVGVKDLIDVSHLPTRAGSTTTSADAAEVDAACVARLRALGAVVQGKTVTTEFGYFAPGPTRNPHGSGHTPGGSSSGSAAAVGAGTIPLAVGTQTAGSLTRPASYCGATGMVLAHASTDLAGVAGLSESLDSLGLLTRSVADLRHVFAAFTGRHNSPPEDGIPRVRIWRGSDLGVLDPAMARLINALPALLTGAGIDAEPLEWDNNVHTLTDDHATVMACEAAQKLEAVMSRHSTALSEPLRELVSSGRRITDLSYRDALRRRKELQGAFADLLGECTVVIGPAALGPAPVGLGATGSPVLSRPWQLLGAPVVVVAGARDLDGMPLGVQLIGRPGCEDDLFAVAAGIEPVLRSMPAP